MRIETISSKKRSVVILIILIFVISSLGIISISISFPNNEDEPFNKNKPIQIDFAPSYNLGGNNYDDSEDLRMFRDYSLSYRENLLFDVMQVSEYYKPHAYPLFLARENIHPDTLKDLEAKGHTIQDEATLIEKQKQLDEEFSRKIDQLIQMNSFGGTIFEHLNDPRHEEFKLSPEKLVKTLYSLSLDYPENVVISESLKRACDKWTFPECFQK